jgi:transposase-like protein
MALFVAPMKLTANKLQHTLLEGVSIMARLHCPRCRGSLFFTAEDNLPRYSCLACGRSFVPERKAPTAAQAA